MTFFAERLNKYKFCRGIAGINTGIDTLVSKEESISKHSIPMRYRKVSIPELGIEIHQNPEEGIKKYRYPN